LIVVITVVEVLILVAVVGTPLVDVFVVAVVFDRCFAVKVFIFVDVLMEAETAFRLLTILFKSIPLASLLFKLGYPLHGVEFDELEAALVELLHECYYCAQNVLVLVLLALLLNILFENFLIHLSVDHRLVLGALGVAAAVAARDMRPSLRSILWADVVLLHALDVTAFGLGWGHPLRRCPAVGVRLLVGWVARTLSPLWSLEIACPWPIVRCLGPLRALVLDVAVWLTHVILLVVKLTVVASLLYIGWKSPHLGIILILTLIGRSPLELPANRLERVLLLLQHDLWREFQLRLSRSLALRLAGEPTTVLIASVDPQRTLITIWFIALLTLQKQFVNIRNSKMIQSGVLTAKPIFFCGTNC
jgi:hypothetical protein